jgi:tetratricopeptide (TPR) repeat protein
MAAFAGAAMADERRDCEKLGGEAGIKACTALIEAGTHSADVMAIAYHNRGLEYFKQRNYEQAINDYSAAVSLNPGYADAYNNRGNAYHIKHDYERALADFDRAIALAPRHALAYNNRGIVHEDRGEAELAIQDYSRAIEINPGYASAYNNRGYAYERSGHEDLAIADFDKAIALNPDIALFYRNRAKAYQSRGDYEVAARDYRRSLELRPNERALASLKTVEALIAAAARTGAEAPAEATFRRMPNTDLEGSLIGNISSAGVEECETACSKDSACNAYSFNAWNSKCFLKRSAKLRYLEPSTTSGLKGETYPPPISDAAISMVRFRNKVFPGTPLREAAEKRFEDCETSCRDSDSCVAFSFLKADLTCQLFDKASEYSSDDGADSGAKRQIVN